ncbi:MAG: DUF695 domain-containing protein [Bacteroidota bacterium]
MISMASSLSAQWDYYEALWQGRPGTVVLNMDMGQYAPIEDMPFLVEVRFALDSCDVSGYGLQEDIDNVEHYAAQVDSVLSTLSYADLVGSFHHECSMREFFYIGDSSRVLKTIDRLDIPTILSCKIIHDPEWKGYLNFLYPDAYLQQTMVNAKTVKMLAASGDDVTKPRRITHYAGFTAEADRQRYRLFLIEQGFKIRSQDYDLTRMLPYAIVFSRRDQAATDWISPITLRLSDQAIEWNGAYEGWESEIQSQ